MTRRILTARDQVQMLAPWRTAAPDPSIKKSVKKFVRKLHDEMKQWAREADEDDFGGDPSNPAYNWEDIENFLKNRYPAAHRGIEMGMEDARPLVHGEPSSFDAPYETGPEAEAKYGYDPHQVAGAMVLLHNKADGDRDWAIPEDMGLLVDIFTKRQRMQRDYEQRQTTAMADPMAPWRGAGRSREERDREWREREQRERDAGWSYDFDAPRDVQYNPGDWRPDPVAAPPDAVWHHVSPHELEPGTVLTPGGSWSQWGTRFRSGPYEARGKWTWMDTPEMADWWDESKSNHVYEVRPSDPPRPWNNTGADGWVAPSATVVRRVRGPLL